MIRQLHLLGSVRIRRGDEVMDQWRSHRAVAVLAYLVCQKYPVPRSELVELIWPDKPEKRGRANLRWVLNYLGKALPECWQVTRQTVQFQPDDVCWVDVLALQQALAVDDLEGLETAVAAAEGEFCRGFYFDESPEFETWLLTQRERWRLRQTEALNQLVAHHVAQGAYTQALPFARQLQNIEPWDETARQQIMNLLAHAGEFNQALAEYERFRTILQEEFGVQPALQTERVRQRILWARQAPRHNLPQVSQTFVGRQDELARLHRWLHDDTVRLVTISGVGGIGKTRLALEAARCAAGHFINGIAFVSLEDVADGVDLPNVVLQTLVEAGFIPAPALSQEPDAYLAEQLRQREMLLLLDNYEHLLPNTHFLQNTLSTMPYLKLIVTSRERLRLLQERWLQLAGIPDMEEARQLFLSRAQIPTGEEESEVVDEICRLVDCMPLAMELAAGWAQVQNLREIAAELQQGLDLLVDRFRDRHSRHVSIEAVFEQSWQRLTAVAQHLLLCLPVFHGPFAAEWAVELGGASRLELAGLLDKSLLQRHQKGFQLHPLLQQFLRARLEPDVEREARNRHLAIFARYLGRHHEELYGQARGEAMQAVAAALPEIVAAWEWAVANRREEWVAQMERPLHRFFSVRGPLRRGVSLFQLACDAFPAETPLGARLRLSKAELLADLGQHEAACQAVTDLLPQAEPLLSQKELAQAHYILSGAFYMTGSYGKARTHSEQVLQYTLDSGDRWLLVRTYGLLGLIALAGIEFDDDGVYQKPEWRRELLPVAVARFEQSLQLAREVGDPGRIISSLHNLGYCHWREGDYTTAARLFQQVLDLTRQSGGNDAQTRNWLAVTQASMGEFAAAETTARQALQAAWQIQRLPFVMDILSTFGAKIFMHVGRRHEAISLLTYVAAHPRTDARIVQRCRLALEELRTMVPEASFAAAEAEAASFTLEQLVAAYTG